MSRLPRGRLVALGLCGLLAPTAVDAQITIPEVVVRTSRPKAAPPPKPRAAAPARPRVAAPAQPRTAPARKPPAAVAMPARRPPQSSPAPARIAARPAAPASGPSAQPGPAGAGAGQGPGSLTQPGIVEQRRALERNAGSVAFIDAEERLRDRAAGTLVDALRDTPGIYARERYGQEIRLSVRGSALARGFHLRGIELLQDGIPFNLADGSGDFYQIDPLSARSIEVYKGGNGLAFGSSTLGGAVNVVTPTALTAIAPNVVRVEGGSFNTLRANVQASRVFGDVDALVSATETASDGYRTHSRSDYQQFNANLGYRLGPDAETRFYLGGYLVRQKLPGTLPLLAALADPRRASATALAGNQSREVWAERIANRTSVRLDVGQIDLDTWFIHKNLYHPIFQVIDQDGITYGVAPRYTASLDLGGFRNDVLVGARFFGGNNSAQQFVNRSGLRGAQTLEASQIATNYEAYAENRFYVLPNLALMAGFKAFRHERQYRTFGPPPVPAAGRDERVYEGFNPKVGLLWEPLPAVQVFADLTRSRDVPDFSDLAQTFNATTRFVPLEAQRAWTAEIGTRGRYDRFTWDVTVYRSVLRDELLQFTTSANVPAATFNAPRTLHQGVELGVGIDLVRGAFASGDRLTLNQVWTYNDFRFDADAQYGANAIAGIPEHVLRTALTYTHPSGFFVSPNLDWVPQGPFADHANTLRVPGYLLVGARTGINLPNGFSLFLDGRNLADRHYISDVSTITDARRAATDVFYPGQGRAVFAGLRMVF